jgi:hypothetical protein
MAQGNGTSADAFDIKMNNTIRVLPFAVSLEPKIEFSIPTSTRLSLSRAAFRHLSCGI